MDADDTLESKVELTIPPPSPVTDKARSELIALSRLERSAIESVRKDRQETLIILPVSFRRTTDSIMAAIDVAEKQMNSLEPREDLTGKISAVGDWHSSQISSFRPREASSP
jgi:hypothetical protein